MPPVGFELTVSAGEHEKFVSSAGVRTDILEKKSLEDPPAVQSKTATFCGYEIGNRAFESYVPCSALAQIVNP